MTKALKAMQTMAGHRPTNMCKAAAEYTVDGKAVQGVGLRKTFHKLLADHKMKGMAVNDADKDTVELSMQGSDTQRNKILDLLSANLKASTGHVIDIKKSDNDTGLRKIDMSEQDLDKLNDLHYSRYMRSHKMDPSDTVKKSRGLFNKELVERYLLKRKGNKLVGEVPELAHKQLSGSVYPYSFMKDENMIRTHKEAMKLNNNRSVL